MSVLDALYHKAVAHPQSTSLSESINDLLIKDLNEECLSAEEIQALKNYHTFKSKILQSAKDDEDFAEKIKKLRIIANFIHWKVFLTDINY